MCYVLLPVVSPFPGPRWAREWSLGGSKLEGDENSRNNSNTEECREDGNASIDESSSLENEGDEAPDEQGLWKSISEGYSLELQP